MTSPCPRRSALFALVLLGSLPALAAEPPGDLWQVTVKMSMEDEGMPFEMPAQTLKICAAKNSQEPPGAENEERDCVSSNQTKVGNKVTWTSTCAGPPEMTGKAEITYEGTDAYTGTISYVSDDGNMTMNLTGRKIGGCDKPL